MVHNSHQKHPIICPVFFCCIFTSLIVTHKPLQITWYRDATDISLGTRKPASDTNWLPSSLDQPASINSRFSSVGESGILSYASWGFGNRKLLHRVISPSQRIRRLIGSWRGVSECHAWLAVCYTPGEHAGSTMRLTTEQRKRQAVVSIFFWFIGEKSV